jgi:hypothetical protein
LANASTVIASLAHAQLEISPAWSEPAPREDKTIDFSDHDQTYKAVLHRCPN